MSSSAGWQTNQNIGKLPYDDSGWGSPNTINSNLTSPLSNPDNWPKLGTQQGDTQQQQFVENNNNMQQQAEPSGWGAPPTNSSAPSAGWGMQQQNSTGWGAPMNGTNNWSRQPQIDNGTALWGKQNQSGSGWGGTATTTTGSSSWNTAPSVAPGPVAPTSQSSNGTPQIEEQNTQTPQISHSSNSAPTIQHQPESWAAAAAAPPAHSQPGPSQPAVNTAKQSTSEPTEAVPEQPPPQVEQDRSKEPDNSPAPVDANDQIHKLVNSHEGWGKTPIQQNTTWNVADTPNFTGLPPNKTGTEAWGKAPSAKPTTPGWQGATNQPTPDQNAQQQWSAPTSNPPVRGWGQQMTTPSPMPPRPPWSGNQPNNQPPPQTGWSDQRLPSPASTMNTNRWNTPSNSMPNPGTQNWNNPTPNVQQAGWNNNTGSGDTSGWGSNVQRNAPPQSGNSSWGAPPPRPEGNWNQQPNMQRQSSTVDDGTSAWGDPKTYKSVSLWDKKSNLSSNANINETSQNKPEPVGWGNPPPASSNNKTSPTGWGDVNPNKAIDDGASSWHKGGSNWDQNSGWGMSKPDHSNGWGGNSDNQTSQWGQPDNDPARAKSKDFGFAGMDRKTSSGSDNVFEEGQMDRTVNGMIGDIGNVGGYGQFPGMPQNNSKMHGLNGPRPVPPQNLMGMPQTQFRQPPPPQLPPQLQSQIRHAVMSGIIPQQILNPQLMTPQHLNHLQHLVMKTQEYKNLSSRMNALTQMNMPPQVRSQQQEQIARGLRQLQAQIQQHQRALTQNLMQKQAAEKNNMGGMGPNSGLGLDLPPSSGSMPQNNSNMSAFNMASMSQNLPNAGNMSSREQQSRLHTWRRPSAGFDNPSDHANPNSVLGPIVQQSISDMIGNAGLLSSADQGNLLGLHQTDNRPTDIMSHDMKGMDPIMAPSHPLDQEQDSSNLKNILADIGPPEFIPGKKWAGFRPIDPENDPDITPGSVAIAKTMSVNTVKDVDQVLNRDRYSGLQTDSTALTDSISNKNQPALASPFANIPNDNPASISSQSTWSSGSRWMENNKNWMVLTNISPQVDLGTLKKLCNISGKMVIFQPAPVRGIVLVKYQTGGDASMMKNHLMSTFGGANMFSIAVASEQEVGNFLNTGNNWNHGSSGRRLHNSSSTMLGNPPQGYGGGPMMPGNDVAFPGSSDSHNLWSTGDNGSNMMHNPHSSWSTGANHAPGRPGMGGMWGGYDNPRVVSPPHNLLPENLLGEQPL